ncbi:EGF-like domain-containing protein [Caerostris darwini]|uniref:EGF-like domain-containing protein n=1 Tax=Caerostris darwini TaxID=1538125 RepID=A0AAV4TMD1_9ARAC|nr:EGF-like domain-containing protein [Caerostris darwini]
MNLPQKIVTFIQYSFYIMITFLLIVNVQRTQNFPTNYQLTNSTLLNIQKEVAKRFLFGQPQEIMKKWHYSNSRHSIDTNIDEITTKPSLKMAIIRELEDELKETESSAHTSTISSSSYNSFINTRALNKLAAENDILQKRIATLVLNKTIPGLNNSECLRCSRLTLESAILKEETTEKIIPVGEVVPAYPCDEWDKHTRTCWLDRNVGDTVTLVLAFHSKDNPMVQWSQEFHVFQSPRTEKYIIDEENPLWNIVIGSKGHEIRISPITEIDIDFNYFKASIVHNRPKFANEFEFGPDVQNTDTVNFRIRVMPLGNILPNCK